MGIFDIFGGGDTSQATDQAINSIWQGNQAYNYAGNAAMGLLNDATGKAINYLQPYYNTGTAAQNQYAGALGVPESRRMTPPRWSRHPLVINSD